MIWVISYTSNMASQEDNRSQLKNPDILGALYILRIQYKYAQTHCEDGAKDVKVH